MAFPVSFQDRRLSESSSSDSLRTVALTLSGILTVLVALAFWLFLETKYARGMKRVWNRTTASHRHHKMNDNSDHNLCREDSNLDRSATYHFRTDTAPDLEIPSEGLHSGPIEAKWKKYQREKSDTSLEAIKEDTEDTSCISLQQEKTNSAVISNENLTESRITTMLDTVLALCGILPSSTAPTLDECKLETDDIYVSYFMEPSGSKFSRPEQDIELQRPRSNSKIELIYQDKSTVIQSALVYDGYEMSLPTSLSTPTAKLDEIPRKSSLYSSRTPKRQNSGGARFEI